MTVIPCSLVHVYFMRGMEKCLMGRLALKQRRIFFEYTAEFLATGLELSPFTLPLKPGVMVAQDRLFDGLFGVFNDSLPDGWGRLLLDRKLMTLGQSPGALSPLDRLCYVGTHGMGALLYEPAMDSHYPPLVPHDLDNIADAMLQFQDHPGDDFVDELLSLAGSSAGARPKIVTRLGDEEWMIKFRSSFDPWDIGPIEYAYHHMARAAGLDVPDARLFASKKGLGYFGTKRFDRADFKRFHMHSISGLLHADHREPSLDYEAIMKATLWLTKDVHQCEKQFRAAVFNVLSHNRDDHAKNFSFLMDEQGKWSVSPAYDLTFSSGPGGEHCSMVMGEGHYPTRTHLLKLAALGGITPQTAIHIMDEVQSSTTAWPRFAEEAGVSAASTHRIQAALHEIARY